MYVLNSALIYLSTHWFCYFLYYINIIIILMWFKRTYINTPSTFANWCCRAIPLASPCSTYISCENVLKKLLLNCNYIIWFSSHQSSSYSQKRCSLHDQRRSSSRPCLNRYYHPYPHRNAVFCNHYPVLNQSKN